MGRGFPKELVVGALALALTAAVCASFSSCASPNERGALIEDERLTELAPRQIAPLLQERTAQAD